MAARRQVIIACIAVIGIFSFILTSLYIALIFRSEPRAFSANALPWDVPEDFSQYIRKFDCAIVFSVDGYGVWTGYKVLGKKDNKWTKAHITSRFSSFDHRKPYKLREFECSEEEIELFISKLERLNFFNLDSERELLEKCPNAPEINDSYGPEIVLVEGWRVRRMFFDSPDIRYRYCEDQQWKDLNSISLLYQNEWNSLGIGKTK